ncbi:MAG: right-handed parallel beta-helix repeat-containing protein [Myxococcota bacterium]
MDLPAALAAAKPGDTLRIPAGRYPVNLIIDKSITLLGVGQVVLDGTHRGSVLRIQAPGGAVTLSALMLVGGAADEAGGGVAVMNGDVELIDCTLRFNKAPQYGGGGLYVRHGRTRVTRCRIEANTGRQGGGVLVDDVAELSMRDSTIVQNAAVDGGGLRVKEGGKAALLGCTIADNKVVGDAAKGSAVSLAGTSSRAPAVALKACVVSERRESPSCLFNESKYPGALTLIHNVLPPWCARLGGKNTFAEAGFVGSGSEPYLLSETSPARGAGEAADFGPDARDVRGEPRDNPPSLGAFAYVRPSASRLGY